MSANAIERAITPEYLKLRADAMEEALDVAIDQFTRAASKVNAFSVGLVTWRAHVEAHMKSDDLAHEKLAAQLDAIKVQLEQLHEVVTMVAK